jgi:hypothetical protein
MRRKAAAGALGVLLVVLIGSAASAQTLTDVYVSEWGQVLGTVFKFDPGYPSYALVKGNGVLVWVDIEIPGAFVELNTFGNVSLVERTSPSDISYEDGRIIRIGDLPFEYDTGRVTKIGDLSFDYYGLNLSETGRINQIGDVPIVIEDGFLRRLGDVQFEYENGLMQKIDDLPFAYENGRVQKIGDMEFDYDMGRLKNAEGEIPGVDLKISSVVEFRRSLRQAQQ